MKNIGIVTTWFERGAAYVSRQYHEVLSKHAEVFIYARHGNEEHVDENYRQDYVTFGKKVDLPVSTALDLEDLKRWIKEKELDIVFFNEQHWWPAVWECSEMGVITGAYVDYYTDETVPLFENYDFLICNTKRHYSAFEWHKQAVHVPWGTDTDLFKPRNFDPVDPEGGLVFFHSCGFSPYRKGTDLLLKAFEDVQGKARLIVHSQGELKERSPESAQSVDRLLSQGRLEIHEKTVAAPGLFHLGDVYVYPSRLEGIGLTMAEGLACGLPLVTSDNPPMTEFTDDAFCKRVRIERTFKRKDNYYWPMCEVDVQDLTACMQHYVDNAHKIPAYKAAARVFAEDKLAWSKNAERLPKVFDEVKKLPIEPSAKEKAAAYEKRRKSKGLMLYNLSPPLFRLLSKLKKK
jgi:glycosyltransferase involved in cell wall biosynthesis